MAPTAASSAADGRAWAGATSRPPMVTVPWWWRSAVASTCSRVLLPLALAPRTTVSPGPITSDGTRSVNRSDRRSDTSRNAQTTPLMTAATDRSCAAR